MGRKVPGALWIPKWGRAPDLVAAFKHSRTHRGAHWEESPEWVASQLGLTRKTAREALKDLPQVGHDKVYLAPIHGALLAMKLPVRAKLLATHIWRRPNPEGYLPTERDYAEDFSWGRQTVVRMLSRLDEKGVLKDEVVHVQGSKIQVVRHIDLPEFSTDTVDRNERVKAVPVNDHKLGEKRYRQAGKTGTGERVKPVPVPGDTWRYQVPPHAYNVVRRVLGGGTPAEEGRSLRSRRSPGQEGRSLRSRRSPGQEGRSPNGSRSFAFVLPDLPPGFRLGVDEDPTWRRILLPETREGLEAGPIGPALVWLLDHLGVKKSYRLGYLLARNGFGIRQVLEHVKRTHATPNIRSRAALLASELSDLLQGFR